MTKWAQNTKQWTVKQRKRRNESRISARVSSLPVRRPSELHLTHCGYGRFLLKAAGPPMTCTAPIARLHPLGALTNKQRTRLWLETSFVHLGYRCGPCTRSRPDRRPVIQFHRLTATEANRLIPVCCFQLIRLPTGGTRHCLVVSSR